MDIFFQTPKDKSNVHCGTTFLILGERYDRCWSNCDIIYCQILAYSYATASKICNPERIPLALTSFISKEGQKLDTSKFNQKLFNDREIQRSAVFIGLGIELILLRFLIYIADGISRRFLW